MYPEVMRAIAAYGEELTGTTFTDRGTIIQRFQSEHGDFTIVEVYRTLYACITKSSRQWQVRYPFSDVV